PSADPVAFTAVTLTLTTGAAGGPPVSPKVLPNEKPFDKDLRPIFVDGAVTRIRFRYPKEANAGGVGDWDGAVEKALPVSIEVTLTIVQGGHAVEQPPLIVSVPVTS